ncbi:S-layer homology domain-containing protein [Thermobacillus sp. ZCTH02-B1]|uniref:S-layer homology domain-containing protein n=1 Tax=Thermobacillus sp. ZCTH02-B1 TaxID=1858795 RepID=UPI0025EE50C0|nr:S-layer homology domain-containing protein [Thermobacillus sp. ZCTH02-B1]
MSVHKWKKWLSAALVCAMLAGGNAVHAENGSGASEPVAAETEPDGAGQSGGAGSGFVDVADNHWAKKHITKLRLQGIIQGTGQGRFNPSGNVSQQDAVLMALRFIGAANKVDPNTQVLFPDTFIVSDYAKPYVMQAISEGLIEENVEFRLAESEPDRAWGTKPATREWVTKLIIRAIGETARAEEQAGRMPGFSDASMIADMYVGYVNAAVELGIVRGFSGNRFAPKNTVTRAEFATMLSRAQQLYAVAYEGQQEGILTGLTDSRLTIAGEDGATKTFTIDRHTLFYRYDSESESLPTGLKPYTRVIVLVEDGRARYVEQMDDDERLERTSGVVVSVDSEERVLYVQVGSRVLPVRYPDGVSVLDRSGAEVGLSALARDSEVDIYRETFSEEKQAVRIELKSATVNKQGRGKIVGIESRAVEILDEGAEQPEKWRVAAAATVSRQGAQVSLAELRVGDVVSYAVENGMITQIEVEAAASRTITGRFDGFSADRSSIIYVVNNRKEISDLATGAKLEIPGLPGATWNDLYKDDQIELTLDGSDKVIAVKVVNRNITTVNGATIVNLDTDRNLLTFLDPHDRPAVVKLTDSTRIEMNESAMTLELAKPLFVKGRKIMISYSDELAIVIRFAYQHTGTLETLDAASRRIVLKLDDGSTFTIPYQSPTVQIYGKSNASLSDLKAGDRITVALDQNLENASAIKVHRIVQMKIASVFTSTSRVRLASETGTTSEHTISSSVRLRDEKGQAITLSQLAAGRTVNAEFAGTDLVGLQLVVVKYGRVVSVAPATVTFAEYGGSVQDIALGERFSIVKNGQTATSTSVLAENDRVEIRTNESGEYVVKVIAGLQKSFWRYDSAANEIVVKISTLNEQNRFSLSADTLVTSGGQPIAVSSLKENDRIVLYIVDGKLIEVEKLQ